MPKLRIILQSKKFVIISLIFICIYVLVFTKVITYKSKLNNDTTKLIGSILSYTIDGNKLSMKINAQEKVQVTYYINSLEEKNYLKENILIGSKVILEGNISSPYSNTIPNTFNYAKYLYNNKIYKIFKASKITLSEKTNILSRIKTKVIHKIEKMDNSRAYLYALILGETDYISQDIYEEYQTNGTTHLFAISGMHISTLVLFLHIIFKKIKVKEQISEIIIFGFLFFYMFLVGFTPSVLRGSLLYIFLLLNNKSNLRLNTINVLYLLFLLLIIINPFYIYNLGFIYSFLTSFGLILFSKKITGNYFIKLIKISAIAFLFSFPITIYNFYEINLLTILNNVIIVPLVTLYLFPLTIVTFVFPMLEPLLNIGINLLEWISNFLNIFAINLVVPKINFIFIIIYYIAIFLIYKYHIKYLFIVILLIISYKTFPYLNSNSYVYFLDVGQGDSTLIIGENLKYVIMIDTGGKINYKTEEWETRNKVYDNSNNIISFLKSKGITKIDLLIATHGDIDHIGYASNIMDEIKVENSWINKNQINELESKILNNTSSNNFKKLEIINLNNQIKEDENNSSLVLYFKIYNLSFLIMGDAGLKIEDEILKRYNLNNIDVLKVGHHGSKTSTGSNFIKALNPKFSIISVGRNNRYNHPHQEVLNNLKNTQIYRTDEDGTIMFKIKKEKFKIKTYSP